MIWPIVAVAAFLAGLALALLGLGFAILLAALEEGEGSAEPISLEQSEGGVERRGPSGETRAGGGAGAESPARRRTVHGAQRPT